jgi:hypothetical protein
MLKLHARGVWKVRITKRDEHHEFSEGVRTRFAIRT